MKAKKKSGSQAEGGARGSLWRFDPHELVIIGHDTDEQDHELCDHESNAFDAEHYTEYINYMRLNGVDKPIVFRRHGGRNEVVEGRTTVRVARVVAPLWEQDRKAEGLKGDDCKLKVPAIVRRGTADELFCVSRATNRRRPGSDSDMQNARDLAKLVNNGAPVEQAATRLGLSVTSAPKLLALLELHPKIQRKVGAGLSLDAAVKLAKLPAEQQIAKLAEIQASGEKPTARAVTNKLREGSAKPAVETPSQRCKKAFDEILRHLSVELNPKIVGMLVEIGEILRPDWRYPANGTAQPAEQDTEFGA